MAEHILDVRGALAEADMVHLDGHFIDHKGRHIKDYVDMDAFHRNPIAACEIGRCLAFPFRKSEQNIQTVVGFGEMGQALAHWTAYGLQTYAGSLRRDRIVTAAYLRREGASNPSTFLVRPKWDVSVKGKRVLVVTDVIADWPGELLTHALATLREYGGAMVGVETIAAHSSLTLKNFDGIPLSALVFSSFETWPSGSCPLCAQGIQIRRDAGKGAAQEDVRSAATL